MSDRPIVVYTINKEPMLVPSYRNFLQVSKVDTPVYLCIDNSAEPDMVTTEVETLPIKRFSDNWITYNGDYKSLDKYIVVDKGLEDFMKIEVRQEWEDKYRKQQDAAYKAEKKLTNLVTEFNLLPWWKKIFKKLEI